MNSFKFDDCVKKAKFLRFYFMNLKIQKKREYPQKFSLKIKITKNMNRYSQKLFSIN